MNKPRTAKPDAGKYVVIPDQECDGVSIRLKFSTEVNHQAPAVIRELLRKSYINRLASEGRYEP